MLFWNQIILLVAKVIPFSIHENTCNYITCANLRPQGVKSDFHILIVSDSGECRLSVLITE